MKRLKKLSLSRETIRRLASTDLALAAGGDTYTCGSTPNCPPSWAGTCGCPGGTNVCTSAEVACISYDPSCQC